MSKKSQLTMFMLLGFVVFGIFGFLLYANNTIAKTRLTGENDRIARDVMNKVPIEQYVTSCLEKVTNDAFTKVGQQGGVLYYNQVNFGYLHCVTCGVPQMNSGEINECGGICQATEDPFGFYMGHYYIPYKLVDDNGKIVVYAVPYAVPYYTPCAAPIDPARKDAPEYPYVGKLSKDNLYDAFGRSQQDMISSFIPLCKSQGTNAMELSKILFGKDYSNKQITDIIDNSCKYCYPADDYTNTQAYLEEYINQSMAECVNLAAFKDIYGYDITSETDKTQTYVTFGEDDVEVFLYYPIKISAAGEKPITTTLNFKINPKIRYRQIYMAVKKIVMEETNNPFFELEDAAYSKNGCRERIWGDEQIASSYDCLEDGMSAERIIDYKPFPNDETDWNYFCSKLGGCAINPGTENEFKNEYDLHYNYADIIKLTDDKSLINGKPYEFYFAIENRKPALDYIDPSPHPDYNHIIAEGESLTIDPYAYDIDEDDYTGEVDKNGNEYMDINYVYDFKEWRTADWSIANNNRVATLNPIKKEDASTTPHTVIVKACETEETTMCDYQDVSILVMDQPEAKIEGSSLGTPTFLASIEDPYVLDGSKSIVNVGDKAFDWQDDKEGALGDKPIITLPANADIKTVKNQGFKQTGTHTITLTVTSKVGEKQLTGTDTIIVNVKNCLSHTSTDASYPYNTGDAFLADHTCCNNGVYATGICYSYDEYTCYQNIGSIYSPADKAVKETATGVEPRTTITTINKPDPLPAGSDNDIWKRTFSQACSGTRGNICSGDTTETWSYNLGVACADKTGTEDERCQGPSPYDKDSCRNNPYSSKPTSCHKYGAGESFEKTFLDLGTANGVCNEVYKRSTLTDYDNVLIGEYCCKAACGNGYCNTPVECGTKNDMTNCP